MLGVSSPNAAVKTASVVGGMHAGADSIDDLDLLRHGGVSRLLVGVRARSTLGTFLRCFTHGHVRQLDKVSAGLPGSPHAAGPPITVTLGERDAFRAWLLTALGATPREWGLPDDVLARGDDLVELKQRLPRLDSNQQPFG
ncbi:hypothetical protein BN12_300006 [Nostocoides japonicum T1-X7]|uniref:Uncharacterized protein n=1 Tax=Nostocoides japonicum T1-X7 TaxID=1194083 RepID=A0A077LXC8_9MICO|nr:hypothetical protein BN12_300006 [Tetrasphaera japonica T1-X7]